jgi:hypothetical protein
MESINQKHTLQAWTQEGDFVPTLYIQGEIPTNGEKPMVELQEVVPQGINPQILLLEFSIDVYDPNGKSLLRIVNYSKSLNTFNDYNSVTIQARKGEIILEVKHRERA